MSSTSFKSILVAVRDPDARTQHAIRKAAGIAAATGARITLFHAFSTPYPLPKSVPTDPEAILRIAAKERTAQLLKLARPLRARGIKVHCEVVWDFPPAHAIVRHVIDTKPDLVVAESHRHTRIARWFLANSDWELIRECPCPVWFVKHERVAKNSAHPDGDRSCTCTREAVRTRRSVVADRNVSCGSARRTRRTDPRRGHAATRARSFHPCRWQRSGGSQNAMASRQRRVSCAPESPLTRSWRAPRSSTWICSSWAPYRAAASAMPTSATRPRPSSTASRATCSSSNRAASNPPSCARVRSSPLHRSRRLRFDHRRRRCQRLSVAPAELPAAIGLPNSVNSMTAA